MASFSYHAAPRPQFFDPMDHRFSALHDIAAIVGVSPRDLQTAGVNDRPKLVGEYRASSDREGFF
ncbi:hypothetical protein AGR7A_Lc120536 [Agrobacterium deltaense NCPPB 1641]|uniref:Uncharacterized protein n=1 Tax=Agrobacterium deltaense NCPPB 1641 TaxID=1183425 RepID=A0A1S7TXU5_9HYPH|nr:hypothetical protein AGR7A_Lc120536 [Agrobacterium deltaense NCPPB 1641]